ncbi:BTBD3_6 [Lepeophtheirus salmonis]|uniref:BTBD3_6 n=1 Tax=Lepeophtheirus salmonis TaxID=72036 RepID=A0A7R8H5F7_LEPSM|nr:BTBD3_6 [Lepeophtheirus salmonis]CAF2878022.1 BTBD3_6 [Lepeophtheirus salmonis]
MGSPVFYTMFHGDFIESKNKKNKIQVFDMEPEVFQSLLGIVKPSNTIYLMSQTRHFNLPVFRDKCWEVIARDSMSSFESTSFEDIDFTTLLDILSNKDLKHSERVAFKAALQWATTHLKVKGTNEFEKDPRILRPKTRKLLGKAIDHIYFYVDKIVCIFVKITTSNKTPEKNKLKETPKEREHRLPKNTDHISSGEYGYVSYFHFKVNRTVELIALTVLSGRLRDEIGINIEKSDAICGKASYICHDEPQQQVYIKFNNKTILERDTEYTAIACCYRFSYYVQDKEPYFSPIFSITSLSKCYSITDMYYSIFS